MKPLNQPEDSLDVSLTVNGEPVHRRIPARLLLADLLRDELGLSGTHVGCEHGICGACTVLLDGAPARSCITLAAQADAAEIVTVEGLTPTEGLGPMQEAFKRQHGLQCGFCTPGFLTTLAGVDPADYPDEESVRELIAGNLCRCTGYQGIVAAVRETWHSKAET